MSDQALQSVAVSTGEAPSAASPRLDARFERLFRELAPYVRRVAPRMGVAQRDVDDVVQEVFLAVYKGLPGFQARSSERTWVYGICIRVCSNHRRRAHRHRERLSDGPEVLEQRTPERRLQAQQALAVMDRALLELTDEQRATFVLHEIEQLSVGEISDALGVSRFTLYARLRRARSHVRAALRAAQPGREGGES